MARATWYAATEPGRLRIARALYGCEYDPDEFLYGGDYPLISVYIPTFNRRDLLMTRALPSILAQTYRNLEVIVANHGSTDGTDDHIRWRTVGEERLELLEVPRRQTYPPTARNHWLAGPVEPANAALDVCRGSWTARCDDDDSWTPDHIEKLLRFAQYGNFEFVSSAYRTHEKTVPHDGETPPIGGVQTWLYRSYLRFMKFNPDCWRKRDGDNAVNDTDLADRFRKAGVRIGHLNEVTAVVLPRPGETVIGLKAYQRDTAETERCLAFK